MPARKRSRSRPVVRDRDPVAVDDSSTPSDGSFATSVPSGKKDNRTTFVRRIDDVLFIFALLLAAVALRQVLGAAKRLPSPRSVGAVELASKRASSEMWLSILGEVYDVTSGAKHYGEGGNYAFFVGRDASSAFATGAPPLFDVDASDLSSLTPSEVLSVVEWRATYREKYPFVGRLIGRYYDKMGRETAELAFVERVAEAERSARRKRAASSPSFPPCHSTFSRTQGGVLSCHDKMVTDRALQSKLVPRDVSTSAESTGVCVCVEESVARSDVGTYKLIGACPGSAQSGPRPTR